MRRRTRVSLLCLLALALLTTSITARPFVLILSQDDLKAIPADPEAADASPPEWDEFGDSENKPEHELDPGSWRPIFEPDAAAPAVADDEYYSAVRKMLSAATQGEPRAAQEAAVEIQALANAGDANAQSVLGFLHGAGLMREKDNGKAMLYHHFAAEGGNLQSMMALAYTYSRQDMPEKAVKLYAELAEVAVNSFLISKDSLVIEPVRIHSGAEENKEALRKSKGEDDEDFQILEYQAQKGSASSMYKIGLFYYFGLRGMRRDHTKALRWFSKAAEKGEPRSMELLGEIYASGAGVERNYTKALEWLTLASKLQLYSAYNGMGYLYVKGYGVEKKNYTKAKEYFEKAADNEDAGGHYNLGVMYFKGIGVKRDLNEMPEKAVKLYAELAEVAVNSFLISKDSLVIEPVRIHSGAEENKEALRKSKGEDDEDFQILEYQAQKGSASSMYKIGLFYYFGLRGMRRDHTKALRWFSKAAEKGEPRSMELLGEIYASGAGVERNYTKALEWLTLASKLQLYSAYNGMGYLYVKGYGVEKKNYTKAKEYFEKAADNEDAGGHYNLGVMYFKGIGVKRDLNEALKNFIVAANAGQPKAFYQLAKMFQTGVGLKKSLTMATALYKLVAERGPWSSLSRWALESYLKGDVGKAFLLYSRMAEMGYEIAQSNAAWILDKYEERSMCMGESGLCSDAERHQRSHSLWWQASEQGNEHAALLIGDAYYYGRGTVRDYERAAEAYMHARSQSNAQAMFNLGYMHEHGLGLPCDLHLAKRYYDQALEIDSAAKLPVSLALTSLWIRMHYAESFLVDMIDALPTIYPKIEAWVEDVILEEGNATILTLFVCLLTVLYFRERQRRHVAAAGEAAIRLQPNENVNPAFL